MGWRKVLHHRVFSTRHLYDALEHEQIGADTREYYTFDPATNETLAHNWFVYDNGDFIMDFPASLEQIGGPAIHLAEMNDSGQIVSLRSNASPDWNSAFLYKDGTFDDIEFPSG